MVRRQVGQMVRGGQGRVVRGVVLQRARYSIHWFIGAIKFITGVLICPIHSIFPIIIVSVRRAPATDTVSPEIKCYECLKIFFPLLLF